MQPGALWPSRVPGLDMSAVQTTRLWEFQQGVPSAPGVMACPLSLSMTNSCGAVGSVYSTLPARSLIEPAAQGRPLHDACMESPSAGRDRIP